MSETENVEQKADKREPSWVQLDVSSIAPNPGDQVLITFVPGERITLMPAVVKWEPKAAGSEPDYKLAFEAARGQIEGLLRMGRGAGLRDAPAFRSIDALWSSLFGEHPREAALALLDHPKAEARSKRKVLP